MKPQGDRYTGCPHNGRDGPGEKNYCHPKRKKNPPGSGKKRGQKPVPNPSLKNPGGVFGDEKA